MGIRSRWNTSPLSPWGNLVTNLSVPSPSYVSWFSILDYISQKPFHLTTCPWLFTPALNLFCNSFPVKSLCFMQIFGKQMFCCFYDTALVLVLVDVLAVVSLPLWNLYLCFFNKNSLCLHLPPASLETIHQQGMFLGDWRIPENPEENQVWLNTRN